MDQLVDWLIMLITSYHSESGSAFCQEYRDGEFPIGRVISLCILKEQIGGSSSWGSAWELQPSTVIQDLQAIETVHRIHLATVLRTIRATRSDRWLHIQWITDMIAEIPGPAAAV